MSTLRAHVMQHSLHLFGTSRRRLLAAVVILLLAFLPSPRLASSTARGAPQPNRGAFEPAPVFCPACGARNRAGSRFCLKDGAPLPEIIPARYRPGFVRDLETLSPEEIQQAITRVSASVVTIRVKTSTDLKYPVVDRDRRPGHSAYYLETLEGEAALSGSGFVIGERGEVVTNAHVARPFGDGARLAVETRDGRSYPASLVGLDRASDLALLRIETASIPPLDWGNSDDVNLGQETWAIGSPLDIGISVTRGTISSIGRMRAGLNQIESYVHSDAYITHGGSGGPLIDVLGRVVGVGSMGYSESRGQGYSIPSNMARRVVERIRQHGVYERGFLGLHVRPVDAESLKRFAVKRNIGVVVESVLPGSPAAASGFHAGDVLFGINGRQAASSYLLQEAVSSVGPNATVRITLDRGGQVLEVPVTTLRRPEEPRIDPVADLETHLMARFEEDAVKKEIIVRVPDVFSIARKFGLEDGTRVQSVVPALDWPVRGRKLEPGSKATEPMRTSTLEELRAALQRAYVGGRIGVCFLIKTDRLRGASVAFDETWPIVI